MSVGHSCYEGARDWGGKSSPVPYSQAWSLAVSSAHFSWSSLSACSWDPPASASQLLILSAGYPALMAFYMGTGDPNSNPRACVTSTFPTLSHLPCPQAFLSEAACEVFCHSNKKDAKRMHWEDCAHWLSCAVLQHLRQWIYREKRFISGINAFNTWSIGPLLLSLWWRSPSLPGRKYTVEQAAHLMADRKYKQKRKHRHIPRIQNLPLRPYLRSSPSPHSAKLRPHLSHIDLWGML